MKIVNLKKFDTLLYIAVVLFSIFYVVILHTSLRGGFIAGADWNNPATKQQYNRALEIFTSTWSDNLYLGSRNSSHTNLWFILSTTFLSHIISDLTLIPLIVIVLIQALAFLTTYHFLKYLKVSRLGALVGGVFLATSPIFFNYLLMGWIYVLLAFSFLNLSLIFIRKGLVDKKISNILLAGVFFGMSFAQAQAILWIPLVVTSYVLFENFGNVRLKRKLLAVLLFLFTGILINAPTVLEVMILPNKTFFNNQILKSGVSIGTSVNAIPVNLIRFLGAGYNSQYESAQKGTLFTLVSFILPLLIITLLINRSKDRIGVIMGFFLLLFIPVLAYIIGSNRELMTTIPGAGIFRDVARFSFVSTYASAILLGIFLDQLKGLNGVVKTGTCILMVMWLGVTMLPWINGSLVTQPKKPGPDVRLRSIKYSGDYFKIEELLEREDKNGRALYLPVGGMLSMETDSNFRGAYRETQDVFAGLSPLPGGLYLADRGLGVATDIARQILSKLKSQHIEGLENLLKITSTKYVVVRTNTDFSYKKDILVYFEDLVTQKKVKPYYEGIDVKVYEIQNPYPLIYSPNKILTAGGGSVDFTSLGQEVQNNRLLVVNTEGTTKDLINTMRVDLEYKGINPTKYNVKITNAVGSLPLVFTDTFDGYWQITRAENLGFGNLFSKNLGKYYTHFVANSYANGWTINTDLLCANENTCIKNIDDSYNINLTIEYFPQRLVYVGFIISITTTLTIVIILIIDAGKRRRETRRGNL